MGNGNVGLPLNKRASAYYSLHANAIEIRAAVSRGGVRIAIAGRAGLTYNVALNGCEGWKIGAALQTANFQS
jgi:hypothetical protein